VSAAAFASLAPSPAHSAASLPPIQQQEWQASIQLLDHEIPLFRRFVERLALWLDLFDPRKHFSSFVPHLALCNEGLMKAILALGARHMSLKPPESGTAPDRTAAVQYYYETLRYLQQAMKFESYNRSLELIATALIVSMYEMIDGAGKGWERHLKGVFWIQRSRNIGAESLGMEGAGWWAWLRQDVWAAFRERRKVYSFHKPTKKYEDMDQYDLASKSVYLLAQAINYSSDQETKDGENNLQGRIERARQLCDMLEEWRRHLSVHFKPLPLEPNASEKSPFRPIWVNPAPLGTAIQMNCFARNLLLIHQPAPGGYTEFFRRQGHIAEGVDTICGIAMCIKDEPSSVSSTQCLFAAGLYTHDPRKREAIVKMIDEHQDRTGWPVSSLSDELKSEWAGSDAR
jgi:Fungal specific transcription factor domain